MRTKRISYRVYGVALNEESAALVQTERFCYIGPGYILIYRRKLGRSKAGWKEMRDLSILPSSAIEWLRQANFQILEEFAREHEDRLSRQNEQFLDRFEKELESERLHVEQKQAEGGGED